MRTIHILMLSAIISLFVSCEEQELQLVGKPNIIFIISDDQAYGDYSFMGHEFIETPSIDKLSQESLTFTRGYATSPLCSPSLASIITGLYAFQHGITGNDPVVEYEGPRKRSEVLAMKEFPPKSYPVQRDLAYQKLSAEFYKHRLITQTLSDNG